MRSYSKYYQVMQIFNLILNFLSLRSLRSATLMLRRLSLSILPLSKYQGGRVKVCHTERVKVSGQTLCGNPSLICVLSLNLLTACQPPAPGGLLFASSRSGNWEIFLQTSAGAKPVNLTRYPSSDRFPDWSPDRKQLVFASDRNGSFDLYLLEPDGNNLRVLSTSPYPDTSPRWSPTGDKIVFVSEREDRNEEIYTIRPQDQKLERITKDPAPDYDPAWFPDGQSLVFISLRSGKPEIYRQNLSGQIEQLTHNAYDKRSLDVSADGKRLLFTQHKGQKWQLAMLELKTGTIQVLNEAPDWLGTPRWQNDKQLLFSRQLKQGTQLFKLALGQTQAEVLETSGNSREAAWDQANN